MAETIDTAGEESMERLMEIAQQQQMLPNRNSANDEPTEQRGQEGVQRSRTGELSEISQEGGRQLPLPANHHRRRNIDRSYGGHHSLRSVSNVYAALSVLMAILALITSPFEFSFFGMSISQGPRTNAITISGSNRLTADTSTGKLDVMQVALDGNGNIIDQNIFMNDEIATHPNGKTLFVEKQTEEKISRPQRHLPPSPTWPSTLLHVASDLRDHFAEQLSIVKLNFEATLILSSTKWTFPWGQEHHIPGTSNNDSDQSDDNVRTLSASNLESVKHISLHSVLSTKAAGSSLRHLFQSSKVGGANNNENATLTSPPEPTIFDKVFTSRPRLVIMVNLLLVVTYFLQAAVADFFLGPFTTMNGVRNISEGRRHSRLRRRAGQERLWGFLIFKLLLVSVALEPTDIDLFILTSWYAFVALLKSLSLLAGTTTSHAIQSGGVPSGGALHLLLLVLICDVFAAVGCTVALRDTGWNMLLLHSSDCIILGADVVTHLLKYLLLVKEETHRLEVSRLEEQQLALRASRTERSEASDSHQGDETVSERPNARDEEREQRTQVNDRLAYEDDLFHLDHVIELRELAYASRLALIGIAAFSLQIFSFCASAMQLLHVWAIHGTGFGLFNWYLGWRMHLILSSLGKKISERRNALRITQEINTCFSEASDKDIRKALAAGDVCCICLNSISFGSVKKVRCGHLFHANCLREVIERERSFAATKCPLCRTSMVVDRRTPHVGNSDVTSRIESTENNDATHEGDGDRATNRQIERAQNIIPGEQSLLRISTENILPSWLPIPAFAFEVVRRDTTVIVEPNAHPEAGWLRFFRRGGQVQTAASNNDDNTQIQQAEEPQEISFWRRLLIMIGAIPMSPEEEATALDQLVDMFPQYDRADLLRELRARNSSEAVAESILLGIFSGVPRGGS